MTRIIAMQSPSEHVLLGGKPHVKISLGYTVTFWWQLGKLHFSLSAFVNNNTTNNIMKSGRGGQPTRKTVAMDEPSKESVMFSSDVTGVEY